MTIYVATDKDGKIAVAYHRLSDLLVASETNFALGMQIERGNIDIRPITVTTTDGIVGKHWQDCDETMLMLRECEIDRYDHEKNVGRSAQFDEGVWKVREDECFENQSTDTIDVCHTMLVQTPDLHAALTHLTKNDL